MTVTFVGKPAVSKTPIDEMTHEEVLTDYTRARQIIFDQKDEIKALKAEVEKLKRHAVGWVGEYFVRQLVAGSRNPYAAKFDVVSASAHLLEVKSSDPYGPGKAANSPRWVWNRLRGSSGANKYDYLILLGATKNSFCFSKEYHFEIFCIPFDEIAKMGKKSPSISCVVSKMKSAIWLKQWRVDQTWIKQYFGDPLRKGMAPVYPCQQSQGEHQPARPVIGRVSALGGADCHIVALAKLA
ncbi:hypothetical protein LJR296_007782 [Cupriavidus necator]|uniref:hypothetical protein n=1 Tax=Cupriavidus necator TaxID=106590 RepID=UPI003ECEEC37